MKMRAKSQNLKSRDNITIRSGGKNTIAPIKKRKGSEEAREGGFSL
jgi:hypothetical protein